MKRIFIILYVLLLCSSIFLSAVPASVADNGWAIDGTKVYIDDSRVYLSADPHTLSSPGWVTFTLTSKQFTGDIDVVWGFDVPTVQPKKAQKYAPYWNNWTTNSTETFYYVSSFVLAPPNASCDYGYSYNSKHYQVNHAVPQYDGWGNLTGWQPTTSIVCFDSYTKNSVNYTATWSERHSKYIEWQNFNGGFEVIQKNHGGMNTWYLLKSVPVVAGQTYILRAWVDIPISTEPISGKYWWCLKPSNLSLSEAIAQDKFYSLDPWYNAAWSHRIIWTATNPTAEPLTNFPIFFNVTIPDESQDDCDDIVFTDLSNNVLPFELDYEDDVNGLFWVNDTIPASSSVSGWLYYGNDAATSQADPEGVWDSNYVLVSHMNDDPDTSHIRDSTSYSNDGTKKAANEPHEVAGAIGKAQSFDGIDDYVDCGNSDSLRTNGIDLTLETWSKTNAPDSSSDPHLLFKGCIYTSDGGYLMRRQGGVYDRYICVIGNGSSNVIKNWGSLPLTINLEYSAFVFINSAQSGELFYNGISKTSQSYGINIAVGDNESLLLGGGGSRFWNGTIDEARISNVDRSASWISAGYEFVVNQSIWVTWGEPISCPCPPTIYSNETGRFWVNYQFLRDDVNCPLTTDGLNMSWTNGTDSGWINLTFPISSDAFIVETPPCTYINITVWAWNETEGALSCDNASESIYFPFDPPSIANVTGNFFANFSFDAGDYADVTNGFNVSWDNGTSSGWINTTDSYVNFSYGPHECTYVNVTVWAWNESWNALSCDSIFATARLPNNAPIISGCDNVTFDPVNKTVYIYLNYTDLDGDICTFSTDFPYGSLDPATGVFVWVINGTMNEYYASFTVNDSYGGNDTCVASLMEIYLYFQALGVTEEQEMLGHTNLFIFLMFLAVVFMFTAFLSPNMTLKIFAGALSGLLFFVEGRGLIGGVFGEELEMAWLSTLLTALGFVMAIFTILSVISMLYMMFKEKGRAGMTGLPYDPDADNW